MQKVLKTISLLVATFAFVLVTFSALGTASAQDYRSYDGNGGYGNNRYDNNRYGNNRYGYYQNNYYRYGNFNRYNMGNRWYWYRYRGRPYRMMYYNNRYYWWNDNDNYWHDWR